MKLCFLFLATLVTLASSLWAMDAAFADDGATATIQLSADPAGNGAGSLLDGLLDIDDDLPGDAEHFVHTEPMMAALLGLPASGLGDEAPRLADAVPRLPLKPPSRG